MRGETAERERPLVCGNGNAVELDCPFDRRKAERHEASLERIAEHQQIACNGISREACRQARRVDEIDRLADRLDERPTQRFGLEIGVAVGDERGRPSSMAVWCD